MAPFMPGGRPFVEGQAGPMWRFGHGDGAGDTIAADCLVMAKIVPHRVHEKLGAVASARQGDMAR